MKHILSLFISGFVFINATAQERKCNIVFETEQAVITDKHKKEINDLAAHLKSGESVIFYPLAYDAETDTYRYTAKAKDQAMAISEYASTIGFKLTGMPKNFPSAYSGLSISVIMKYFKPVTADTAAAPALVHGLKEHYPEKPSQYFMINPLRDTVITGNEGTRLYFKAGSLQSNKKVQVELKEFYSLADYMKNGLPTVSDRQMIQTGGSIYLNATENDAGKKQVPVNRDKGIGVDFTLGKNDPEMQIFIRDPKSKEFNWILPSENVSKESWQMTETVYDQDGKVISTKTFKSKEEWERYQKEEEEKEKKKLEKEAARLATENTMEGKLKILDLGYINCDKFYSEPTVLFTVAADEKLQAEYYLIYTDIRGVVTGSVNRQSVEFGNVAKDRQAVLMAVCFIDKQAYYYKGSVNGGKLSGTVSLQPVEDSFLNQQLAMLK